MTLLNQPLNLGLAGRLASTRGRKSVRVLSLMGAIRNRSPGTRDGRISFSISIRNDARSSFVMLCEKSTKTTTAVPSWVAAGVEGAHPVVRISACVIRAPTQGVSRLRARDLPIMRSPVLAVDGDLRPPVHFGELRRPSKGVRRQQFAKANVGLPVQRHPLEIGRASCRERVEVAGVEG